jgi:hypothetical protein
MSRSVGALRVTTVGPFKTEPQCKDMQARLIVGAI